MQAGGMGAIAALSGICLGLFINTLHSGMNSFVFRVSRWFMRKGESIWVWIRIKCRCVACLCGCCSSGFCKGCRTKVGSCCTKIVNYGKACRRCCCDQHDKDDAEESQVELGQVQEHAHVELGPGQEQTYPEAQLGEGAEGQVEGQVGELEGGKVKEQLVEVEEGEVEEGGVEQGEVEQKKVEQGKVQERSGYIVSD